MTLEETAAYVVSEFERRFGKRLDGGSRFARYLKRFAKNEYTGPVREGDEQIVLERVSAIRDITDLATIFEQFPDLSRDCLNRLKSDKPLPTPGKDAGRDIQFELWTAAILKRGKLAVELKEPDIVVRARGAVVGIAVKRLSSPSRFIKIVREGADQVSACFKNALLGFVVVETTLAWDPEMSLIIQKRDDESYLSDTILRLDRFLDASEAERREIWKEHPNLLGLLVVDHSAVQHPDRGLLVEASANFVWALNLPDVSQRIAEAIRAAWIRGSPQVANVDAIKRRVVYSGPPVDLIVPLRPMQSIVTDKSGP